MGELGKRIGEDGEDLVRRFLNEIGWTSFEEGVDIPCVHPTKHAADSESRKTHGIDVLYRLKSNLEDFLGENVLISVKFSKKKYQASPQITFKRYITELAWAVECFSKSSSSDKVAKYFEKQIRRKETVRVLFWLNNDRKSDQDVRSKICNIQQPVGLVFKRIYVVDNATATFIFDSISKARSSALPGAKIYFNYGVTSQNFKDPDRKNFGLIFPTEYFSSPMISMRSIDDSGNTTDIILSIREEYSEECFLRLISLLRDYSRDISESYTFLFETFDKTSDAQSVQRTLLSLDNEALAAKIRVMDLSHDFRGLLHG